MAIEPPPFTGHKVGHVNGFLGVTTGFFEHFAHLARHVARDSFFVPDENLTNPKMYSARLGGGTDRQRG